MILASRWVSPYLPCEFNSTSKMMRIFSFFLLHFPKVGHQSFSPSHSLTDGESQPRHPLPGAETALNRLRRLLWGRKAAKLQPHGLRRDSGTGAGGSTCQQSTRHACGSVTEATLHASSTRYDASLGPARLPHRPPSRVPIWPGFTTALLTSCSMSWAFLLWAKGPYLEPFLPTMELNHMCFQQYNHLGI